MNRRNFISLLSSSVAAAASAAQVFTGETEASPNRANSKPNFLFLIADDLMFRTINALNNSEIRTPNLDRLVKRGTAFTHCFHQGSWTGAICIASRTMLNSGLGPFQADVKWRHDPGQLQRQGIKPVDEDYPPLDNYPTWGQTLGAAGYDTYLTGKWHLDATALQRSFKETGVVAPGFLPSPDDMYHRPHPDNHWRPDNEQLFGHWINKDLWLNESPEIEHSSELYANCAIDHLRSKVSKRDTPFFMYVGFNAPHDPRQAPKEFLDLYDPAKLEIPPNFLPQHPFDQGEYEVRDEMLCPFPRTHDAVRLHRHEYYAIISHMDHHIGRILDALEASGKASNTYVILTADHGLAVGEHGLMGKQNQYDCSLRMPLIICGPGITPDKRIDDQVYQHSMYATTCEMAGVPCPKHVVFPSLVPLLGGHGSPLYDATFAWLNTVQRSVRTKQHKLIVYPQIRKVQIFDIEKDPWERNDVSADPAYAQTRTDLLARLRQFQQDLGDKLNFLGDKLNLEEPIGAFAEPWETNRNPAKP